MKNRTWERMEFKKRTWKKTFSVFALIMCMLCSMMPVSFFAEPSDSDKDSDTEYVQEIPEDAIFISTVEDLLDLADNCRLNTWSLEKTVVLVNDIDVSNTEFQGIPTFGGTFLGQGYTIKGFNLVQESSVFGFFRYLQEDAVVENLNLDGTVEPEGTRMIVGGFAGENAGTIRNCTFQGTVSGNSQIGGLVGNNTITALIEECTATGTIYGNHFVGGIAGKNQGVIRECSNMAEINTQSVHNKVNLEDITLDSLVNTESVDTTTDIGGIAGSNSGVIRSCENHGAIGYMHMGYNIGGIAGVQNAYVVDCVNYADIQGRKEVGGIVGHMEPNIALNFTTDSIQILSGQMEELEGSMETLENSLNYRLQNISGQVDGLENSANDVRSAIQAFRGLVENDSPELNPDELALYADKLTAATNQLTDSVKNLYNQSRNLQNTLDSAATGLDYELNDVMSRLDDISATINSLDENINVDIMDISREDTDVDTLGKIAGCTNHGDVSADLNAGGITGVMAEESDLDISDNLEVSGDISMNISYRIRVVVRDCVNNGTISANKQRVGGIVGYMFYGAVLDCVNTGNMDALGADYVGGIAGDSRAYIKGCSSKSVIAGEDYVGGIAGYGTEVINCNAFVQIDACTEKAGAVLGYAKELPTDILLEDDTDDTSNIENQRENLVDADAKIAGNYYFVEGLDIGGIDSISYEGATDRLTLDEFLQIPELDRTFKTAKVRFIREGQDDVVLTVAIGDSIHMDKLPTVNIEDGEVYDWKVVPVVTSQVAGIGEILSTEYISKEGLTNILFDEVYELVIDTKDTVIRSDAEDEYGLAVLLAEGSFAKNTVIRMKDMLSEEAIIEEEEALVNWKVTLSNEGVTKLRYLIPEELEGENMILFVKDASDNWIEREAVMNGSYLMFEFTEGETGFALVTDDAAVMEEFLLLAVVIVVVIIVAVVINKQIKKRKKA